MKKKRVLAYGLGILCSVGFLLGLLMLLFKAPASISSGVVVICLSICIGILLPNPISIWGLIAGICMLVLPPQMTGVVIMLLSVAGAVGNCFLFRNIAEPVCA